MPGEDRRQEAESRSVYTPVHDRRAFLHSSGDGATGYNAYDQGPASRSIVRHVSQHGGDTRSH